MTAGASLPPPGVQRPTPPLTEEELAAIDARDKALGPEPLTTALSVTRQLDDIPSFGTSRFVPAGGRASLEVTAGEVVVLRIEDGKDFTCTEPHLSSWGEAAADRRRLIADLRAGRAEVERLRAFILAMLDHGTTTWSDTSCGSGGIGGQAMTTTAHPEVIEHLATSALRGASLSDAADDYSAWVPNTARLDEKPRRPRRRGPDGRPV